jgi:hypothetical protein
MHHGTRRSFTECQQISEGLAPGVHDRVHVTGLLLGHLFRPSVHLAELGAEPRDEAGRQRHRLQGPGGGRRESDILVVTLRAVGTQSREVGLDGSLIVLFGVARRDSAEEEVDGDVVPKVLPDSWWRIKVPLDAPPSSNQ